MKLLVCTSNQPRHVALVKALRAVGHNVVTCVEPKTWLAPEAPTMRAYWSPIAHDAILPSTAVTAVRKEETMAKTSAVAAVGLGAATMGIGLAAVGVYLLAKHYFTVSKAVKEARKDVQAFQQELWKTMTAQQRVETVAARAVDERRGDQKEAGRGRAGGGGHAPA